MAEVAALKRENLSDGAAANMIEQERDVAWTLGWVCRLLAAADEGGEERTQFYFPGLAILLDRCGGNLNNLAVEIERRASRGDG